MAEERTSWIATVDERRARIFRCTRTLRHGWHVEEHGVALRNIHEEDHERRRPAILGSGPHTMPPHEAGWGHEQQEEQRRFARDVAHWLEERLVRSEIDALRVFAPTRFLGLLREYLPERTRGTLRLMEGELAQLRPHELAEHPAVRAALSPGPAPGPPAAE
jgi:protein required for attachment to host cells